MAIEDPEKTKILEASKALPMKIDEVLSLPPVIDNHNNNISNKEDIETDPEEVNKWLKSIGKFYSKPQFTHFASLTNFSPDKINPHQSDTSLFLYLLLFSPPITHLSKKLYAYCLTSSKSKASLLLDLKFLSIETCNY